MDPRSEVLLRQAELFQGSLLLAGLPADDLLGKLPNAHGWCWHAGMKGCVKAGDSTYTLQHRPYGFDGVQGAWLVHWCEARQSGDAAQDFIIDLDGACESVAAVNDPVTDNVDIGEVVQPFDQTIRFGRPVPWVEVEAGLDLVACGDESELEGA